MTISLGFLDTKIKLGYFLCHKDYMKQIKVAKLTFQTH